MTSQGIVDIYKEPADPEVSKGKALTQLVGRMVQLEHRYVRSADGTFSVYGILEAIAHKVFRNPLGEHMEIYQIKIAGEWHDVSRTATLHYYMNDRL